MAKVFLDRPANKNCQTGKKFIKNQIIAMAKVFLDHFQKVNKCKDAHYHQA